MSCYRSGCVSIGGLARTIVQLGAWQRQRRVFKMIVANSDALARTLRENNVKVDSVIGNGTRIVPARPPLGKTPTIVFAGRLLPAKGADVLLSAMVRVLEHQPLCRLIVAGEGPERLRLQQLIDEAKLGSHVELTGHLTRPLLEERFAHAWVQAVPSLYLEPFANVLAEAMMRGTPVVATDTGGTSSVVRDGVTGFLVRSGDADALAARILTLVCNRAVAERMGAAAREIALAELTTDRMIDRFEDAYAAIRR
jgi:glycosyltransferase involved in cell wall biosynthesis